MNRRSVLAVLVALFCSLLAVGPMAASATAASVCDTVIYDGANVLGDGKGDVQDAVEQLQDIGAEVRVITLDNLGKAADLETYLDRQTNACPSWQAPNGVLADDMLVYAIDMDSRDLQFFYGDNWVSSAGAYDNNIIDAMGAEFSNGRFASGFTVGMQLTQEVIGNDPSLPVTGGGDGQPASTSEPTDWTGFWWVLSVAGIVILVVGLLLFAVAWYRRYQDDKERQRLANQKRLEARQQAIAVRDKATALTGTLGTEANMDVRESRAGTYAAVGEAVAAELSDLLGTIRTEHEASTADTLKASQLGDVEDETLGLETYQSLEQTYQSALEHAEAAVTAAKSFDAKCKEIDAKRTNLAGDKENLESQLQVLEGRLAELRRAEIDIAPINTEVQDAYALLKSLSTRLEELSSVQAMDDATAAYQKAVTMLGELERKRQEIDQAMPALDARLEAFDGLHAVAVGCFERIASVYAEVLCDPVKGNGSEAEDRANEAEKLHEVAIPLSINQQEWDEAIAGITQANTLLDQAESLLRSITELESQLQEAARRVQSEIDAASADIAKAEAYIRRHKSDVNRSLTDNLLDAQNVLASARELLAEDKPDYPRVIELALEANSNADAILKKAMQDSELAERLRRKATSTMASARAAVSKAHEFILDHQEDVGERATTLMSTANSALRRARQYDVEEHAQHMLDAASDALRDAGEAYEVAQRDFTRAENDREEDRRREQEQAQQHELLRQREDQVRRNHAAALASAALSINLPTRSSQGGGRAGGSWGSGGGGGRAGGNARPHRSSGGGRAGKKW